MVKLSAFGDIVHALPVAAFLKKLEPSLKIDWLVEHSFVSLVKLSPWVNRIVEVDTKEWRKEGLWKSETLTSIKRVLQHLRCFGYDFVLDLQGNTKSGLFTWAAKASKKYGFPRNKVRELPNVLATDVKLPISDDITSIRNQLLELARLALSDYLQREFSFIQPTTLHSIKLPEKSSTMQKKILKDMGVLSGMPLLGVHMGTTWKTKKWPFFFWMELSRKVVDNSLAKILFFWGNDEEKKEVSRSLAVRPGMFFMWKGGAIEDLASAISFLDAFVGPDTGPLHLASLIGVPTVSLFTATDAHRNAPPGENHISIQAPTNCSPCLKKSCRDNDKCSTSISPEKVYEAVRKILYS